jgi:hypothetical protein
MTVDPASVERNQNIFNGLPTNISYQYRLHRVLTGALASIIRTTDLDCCTGDSSLLDSLIDYSDGQAQQVSPADGTDIGECAKLQ